MTLESWTLVAAFVLTTVAIAVLRPALRCYGVLDVPNHRSSHVTETLRGGGAGPLIGIAGAGALLVALVDADERMLVAIVLVVSIAAGVLGLLEDVRGVSVLVRAGVQLLIGAGATVSIVAVTGASPWLIVLGAVAVAGYINIANFMDGVNGISSLHGAVVGGAYAGIGALLGQPAIATVAAIVALAFLAFLPWNLARPGLFLGDVGSYLLGGGIAALALALVALGANPITVLAPISIYLADTGATLIRRAARGEAVLKPHRTHVYQRLTDTGMSHVAVAVLVASFSAVAAGVGLSIDVLALPSWVAALLIIGVATVYLLLPRMRGNRIAPPVSYEIENIPSPPEIQARPELHPKSWVVLGATGFVGSALVDELTRRGLDVRAASAPRVEVSAASSLDEIAQAAQGHPELRALITLLGDADIVINAAGVAAPDSAATDQLYGGNALLPALLMRAAAKSGAARVVHISSAAVQGRRRILDESIDVAPFSPYSRSKALGERAFFVAGADAGDIDAIVVRATSVQGVARGTTQSLQRIAASPLGSVAGDGSQPTCVSSIDGLVDFVLQVAATTTEVGPVMLQPWEGLSAGEVLKLSGKREPKRLPKWVCVSLLALAREIGRVVPEIAGAARRLELMWMGQRQESRYSEAFRAVDGSHLRRILESGRSQA